MPTVKLAITRVENQPTRYLVVVNGEGFFQSAGKKVGARIRGDDTVFDDQLFGIMGDRVQHDGSFNMSQVVPGSQLNEDWGRDEIYALADVEDTGTFKSNTVRGNF